MSIEDLSVEIFPVSTVPSRLKDAIRANDTRYINSYPLPSNVRKIDVQRLTEKEIIRAVNNHTPPISEDGTIVRSPVFGMQYLLQAWELGLLPSYTALARMVQFSLDRYSTFERTHGEGSYSFFPHLFDDADCHPDTVFAFISGTDPITRSKVRVGGWRIICDDGNGLRYTKKTELGNPEYLLRGGCSPEEVKKIKCGELGSLYINPDLQGQHMAEKSLRLAGDSTITSSMPSTGLQLCIIEATPGSVKSILQGLPKEHMLVRLDAGADITTPGGNPDVRRTIICYAYAKDSNIIEALKAGVPAEHCITPEEYLSLPPEILDERTISARMWRQTNTGPSQTIHDIYQPSQHDIIKAYKSIPTIDAFEGILSGYTDSESRKFASKTEANRVHEIIANMGKNGFRPLPTPTTPGAKNQPSINHAYKPR